ncbi:MAG: hypothetical protein Q9192_007055 [Flavoplaca navasiana]
MVIRLGIIGLSADPQAWATMAHVAPIKGSLASHYTITAVATSTPETAKASAKAHGLPKDKGYSSPEDIANDPDVDMLTTPALRAQKDVFVEWPFGSVLQEAQEIAGLARKQGVRSFVGLQSRRSPTFVKTATTYPTMRFISPNGSLSPPEPKRHADNVAVSGLLTPGDAVLNFYYLITAPATPAMFQCVISGEKGALKMEGKSFAVQAKPPILYLFKAFENDSGAKGIYGHIWDEVKVEESKLGGVGGVAEVYKGIAEGKGVEDVGDLSSLVLFPASLGFSCFSFA